MSDIAMELQNKIDALEIENASLAQKIGELDKKERNMSTRIDEFVEEWYEQNKDLVDIGEIEICGKYKVDLIPDDLEKRIYTKMLKIVFAYLARSL
tara:strand:+ start:1334 stop:1621 length:288 start_codon:yes stop_codon:yes gene_type:complete